MNSYRSWHLHKQPPQQDSALFGHRTLCRSLLHDSPRQDCKTSRRSFQTRVARELLQGPRQ